MVKRFALTMTLALIAFLTAPAVSSWGDSTDTLIDQLVSAPKDQWDIILTANRESLNESYPKKLTAMAGDALARKDYMSARLYMELADYGDYVNRDKKEYGAFYQYYLGQFLSKQGENDVAMQIADGIMAVSPGNAKGFLLKGKIYLSRKETEKALPELKAAVEKDPNSEDGQMMLGYARLLNNDMQSALKSFREVLRINPGNVYAKDAVAMLTSQSGAGRYSQNSEAMAHFNQAEELFKKGKYEEAISEYRKAAELDPKFAKAWVYMGDCYHALGNNEKAIESYRKAIEIDPKDRQAHRFLGDVLEKMYDSTGNRTYLDEAIRSYENAVNADPSYATAVSDLARAKAKKNRNRQ